MLILFTSEENHIDEKMQLLQFFERGLQLLHVRKPGFTEAESVQWLSQFDRRFLNRMVLHQHHGLAEEFGVKGIHLKEKDRLELKDVSEYLERYKAMGFTVSTSFHNPEILDKEANKFAYVFLSPVFSSISKTSYEGKGFDVRKLSHRIIALGGIEEGTISKAKDLGYAGVAVMGAIWLNEIKEQSFASVLKEYENVYK